MGKLDLPSPSRPSDGRGEENVGTGNRGDPAFRRPSQGSEILEWLGAWPHSNCYTLAPHLDRENRARL